MGSGRASSPTFFLSLSSPVQRRPLLSASPAAHAESIRPPHRPDGDPVPPCSPPPGRVAPLCPSAADHGGEGGGQPEVGCGGERGPPATTSRSLPLPLPISSLVTVTLPVPAERRCPCASLILAAGRPRRGEHDSWAPRGRGPVAAEDASQLRRLVVRAGDVGFGLWPAGCRPAACSCSPAPPLPQQANRLVAHMSWTDADLSFFAPIARHRVVGNR